MGRRVIWRGEYWTASVRWLLCYNGYKYVLVYFIGERVSLVDEEILATCSLSTRQLGFRQAALPWVLSRLCQLAIRAQGAGYLL